MSPWYVETPAYLIQFQYGTKIYSLGSIIFMRSYAVEYYIGSFVGNQCSVVHFTHQAVHNTYVEKMGKPLWEFNKMPKWWQKLRMHLNL